MNDRRPGHSPTLGGRFSRVLIEVTDADDSRLGDYVRLRDTALRRALETERGLFIAEGEKVIRRAVEAGHEPRSFLLADRVIRPARVGVADPQ